MQIIRRGNQYRDRRFQAECPWCTCLFSFARAEATIDRGKNTLQVICPDESCQHVFDYTPKLHESQGEL